MSRRANKTATAAAAASATAAASASASASGFGRGVWIDGEGALDLGTVPILGHGGEADVYDLGDRALKLYKTPAHPDIAGDPAREAAAAARLAQAEARLGAFPRNLPARVAVPRALVRAGRGGVVAGYVMDKVTGRPLFELGEPRVRRAGGLALEALVAALRDLHATVTALHAAGVIIGDFNDGNVLVDLTPSSRSSEGPERAASARRVEGLPSAAAPRLAAAPLARGDGSGGAPGGPSAALIDADSFAYGAWPCPMFTERFVDPRLCDPAAPAPALVRPHDAASDWFAYSVMLFRLLCWVGPFGGVYQPSDPALRLPAAARPLRGPSVFHPEVVYPRSAAPLAALSDELIDHFSAAFDRGARGVFPAALLDRLRLRRCDSCAIDHARPRCPSCTRQVAVPRAWGQLTVTPIDPATLPVLTVELDGRARDTLGATWMAGSTLWHRGPLGPEAVGQIVPGVTRLWRGPRLGAGMWRAGGCAVGLTFVPGRRGLDDRARLPAVRGRVLAQGCIPGDDRAWLWWRELDGARERVRLVAIASGKLLAETEADASDLGWLAGLAGACAAGPHLFVPTDDGIVRAEVTPAPAPAGAAAASIAVTRRFPDTRDVVAAGDDLIPFAGGLAVRKPGAARAYRLTFSAGGST